jgi:hypothetical protein
MPHHIDLFTCEKLNTRVLDTCSANFTYRSQKYFRAWIDSLKIRRFRILHKTNSNSNDFVTLDTERESLFGFTEKILNLSKTST